jgi:hypothetical protein
MLLDRAFQPWQNVGNRFDIPFSRDRATLMDQPQVHSSIPPRDRDANLDIMDLLEFLLQRPHAFIPSRQPFRACAVHTVGEHWYYRAQGPYARQQPADTRRAAITQVTGKCHLEACRQRRVGPLLRERTVS